MKFAWTFFLTAFLGTVYAQTPVLLTAERADSLLRAMPDIQLLDVRTASEYGNGHLKNARNFDVRDSTFAQRLNQLDPNKPVLVYCLSGGRSAKASSLMASRGFRQVYDMKGGYAKWTAAGKPVTGAKPAAKGALTMAEFTKLTAGSKPVLVDFFAKWCAPCQEMLPMINRMKTELASQVTILTLDYDQNKELAKQLGVDEIPTFLLYKDQQLKWRGLGTVQEAQFREKIQALQ